MAKQAKHKIGAAVPAQMASTPEPAEETVTHGEGMPGEPIPTSPGPTGPTEEDIKKQHEEAAKRQEEARIKRWKDQDIEKSFIKKEIDYWRYKAEFMKCQYEVKSYQQAMYDLSNLQAQRDYLITETIINVMKEQYKLVIPEPEHNAIVTKTTQILAEMAKPGQQR